MVSIVTVTFDIPEWAIGRHINIFAGTELLGKMQYIKHKIPLHYGGVYRSSYYKPLTIKNDESMRCSGCGDCCSTGGAFAHEDILHNMKERLNNYTYSQEGACVFYDTNTGCIMKGSIPFSCAKSNCEGWSDNCTEKLITLEVF